MPTRFGLRINPTSGTSKLGIELSGVADSIGLFNGDEETEIQFIAPMVSDSGGGTLGFYGGPGTRYGLYKTVPAGAPWTIWFTPPEGTWTFFAGEVDVFDEGDPQNTRIRLIVEIDGVETEIFNIVSGTIARDNGFSDWFSSYGETVDLTFGSLPPEYSNFWTGFNRTRENAPT